MILAGVIFALKVLCNYYFPAEDAWFMGWFPIPSKYASWAELILIQMTVPNASFVGHLSGILVGMLYVQGPLKGIMDAVWSVVGNSSPSSSSSAPRFHGSGTTRRGPGYAEYTGGLSEEEQMRRAMEESRRTATGKSSPMVAL